jgi:hypothetical protein
VTDRRVYLDNIATIASKVVGYSTGIVFPNEGLPAMCAALHGSVVVACATAYAHVPSTPDSDFDRSSKCELVMKVTSCHSTARRRAALVLGLQVWAPAIRQYVWRLAWCDLVATAYVRVCSQYICGTRFGQWIKPVCFA